MSATKPIPLYSVDDDKTVLAPPPTFLEEDAVTKVSIQRVRAVPPMLVSTGDEPTRIVDFPLRPLVGRAGEIAAAPNDVSTLVTRGRSPLRFAIVALALVIAGLLGTLWRRSHLVPAPQAAATMTSAAAITPSAPSTPAKPPTPVARMDVPPEPAGPATTAPPAMTTTSGVPSAPPSNEERAAVEAVASGSYAQAAKLYQALADTHPSNDAYRAAARILLDRSKESAR
jgi:hypothetical protein